MKRTARDAILSDDIISKTLHIFFSNKVRNLNTKMVTTQNLILYVATGFGVFQTNVQPSGNINHPSPSRGIFT